VSPSMPREQARRYVSALWHAVHVHDLRFEDAERFARWWTTSGWMFHREIRDGFLNWQAANFPRPVDDEE
jgi:hypothetical protein